MNLLGNRFLEMSAESVAHRGQQPARIYDKGRASGYTERWGLHALAIAVVVAILFFSLLSSVIYWAMSMRRPLGTSVVSRRGRTDTERLVFPWLFRHSYQ